MATTPCYDTLVDVMVHSQCKQVLWRLDPETHSGKNEGKYEVYRGKS